MSDRDQLAEIIERIARRSNLDDGIRNPVTLAGAIIAAGWCPPADEFDAYVVAFVGSDGPELWCHDREIVHGEEAAQATLARMRREEPHMGFQLYRLSAVTW